MQRRHKDKPEFLRHAVYLLGNIAMNDQLKVRSSMLSSRNWPAVKLVDFIA